MDFRSLCNGFQQPTKENCSHQPDYKFPDPTLLPFHAHLNSTHYIGMQYNIKELSGGRIKFNDQNHLHIVYCLYIQSCLIWNAVLHPF